ncbi:hypothetical protein [Bacillus tuaregi]|uniref:hypothetical protein n=1 Tax=Bacillus tuaregi TaxID=1816695 RepID=UPI0008F8BA98|nr:hypothetical protein [Bacillus tuaregi]
MNFSGKKQHLIILIGILLFVGIVAGGYFLYLQPLNDKLDRKQTELDMANQQLSIIESKTVEAGEQTAESSMKLQKLVPVKRQLEQLILDIEKAEIISNVMIDEIRMNGTDADELIEVEQKTEEEDTSDEEAPEGNADEEQEEADREEDEEEIEMVEVELPEGVNRTSISIKGTAVNYFELERFIDSLLSLNRIIVIDNLSFEGNSEYRKTDQEPEKTEFELAMSAFYYPKLVDLIKELPPIDTPEAANKKNPLNSFPNDVKKD